MTIRRSLLPIVAALLAACAALPPSQETFYFDENAMAPLPTVPLIEYPPIEPVQMPPPVEPTLVPGTGHGAVAPPDAKHAAIGPAGGVSGTVAPAPPPVVVAALPPSQPAAPAIPPEDLEALGLMGDLARYGGLTAEGVKRELTAMSQTFKVERNDANRIRLAVLYTLTHSAQDDLRAQQLLDNVAKSGGPHTAVKRLASVLQTQVTERTRALREESARANEAVQKLEALRQMERSLLRDRVSSGGGSAGGGTGGGGR